MLSPDWAGLSILCQAVDDYIKGGAPRAWDEGFTSPELRAMHLADLRQEILVFWYSQWALDLMEWFPKLAQEIRRRSPSLDAHIKLGREFAAQSWPEDWFTFYYVNNILQCGEVQAAALCEAGVNDGWLERQVNRIVKYRARER